MPRNSMPQPGSADFFRALTLVVLISGLSTGASAAMQLASASLADMSLEELSNLEITSVSKHAERLSDAAASIFVITADDIRRSGATSLPEALRLAPNLEVAQVNSSSYAISARGFNNAIGNKLLVMIDGRTVYTPLYSGVNWDTQNVMLEDVERIEVISGPGATLWGANAVNGVINVITRRAEDTQGGLVSVGGGNHGSDGTARHGGKIGDDGYYRVYGMASSHDNTELANGKRVADSWEISQGGFRADWGSQKNGFTLQGDTYHGTEEPMFSIAGGQTIAGANLLTRWNRELEDGSTFQIQAYYDYTERDSPFTFNDATDTFDIELQHGFTLAETHRILWGGGYRYAYDDSQIHVLPFPLPTQELRPASRNLEWGNLFVQDEVALSPKVNLTLGLKGETNVYTGLEYLPSVRLAWKLDTDQLVWGALSRAVRAPARIDRDYLVSFRNVPLPPPFNTLSLIRGGPDFDSEVADVMEIGYRAQPSSVLSYSVTTFYSYYDKLRSGQTVLLGGPGALIQNMMEGTTHGIEAWGNYQVTPAWRLSAGLTTMHEQFKLKPGSTDPDGSADAANDPANTWMLRSTYNLTSRHDFDMTLRHVSSLNPTIPPVPQYTAVDARLAWRPQPDVELSLTLQNIFAPAHIEFNTALPPKIGTPSEIDRIAYFKVRWSL